MPKTIQFKGAGEYSDAELAAAVGLKKGTSLTAAQINEAATKLSNLGLFESVNFTYNGQDLVFALTPSSGLYPIYLENLPPMPGREMDEAIHAHVPLYHGKVPLQGTLLDSVTQELTAELAAKGIQASITSAPQRDSQTGMTSAESFRVASPAVHVGEIQFSGQLAGLSDNARKLASKFIGSDFDAAGSVSQFETNVGIYYREQGYVQAEVKAVPQANIVVNANEVLVPFSITVREGPLYHLSGIELAPDVIVTQAAFDKQSELHKGEVVSLGKLRADLGFITRQYHNSGYMKAQVISTASFDAANGNVSYKITTEPGPVYTMGTLKIENVSDDLRAAIVSAWTIAAGATFNEGAVIGMFGTYQVHPALERVFASADARYTFTQHDDSHTVDVDLTLTKKH